MGARRDTVAICEAEPVVKTDLNGQSAVTLDAVREHPKFLHITAHLAAVHIGPVGPTLPGRLGCQRLSIPPSTPSVVLTVAVSKSER
jgi:hypothetical protein